MRGKSTRAKIHAPWSWPWPRCEIKKMPWLTKCPGLCMQSSASCGWIPQIVLVRDRDRDRDRGQIVYVTPWCMVMCSNARGLEQTRVRSWANNIHQYAYHTHPYMLWAESFPVRNRTKQTYIHTYIHMNIYIYIYIYIYIHAYTHIHTTHFKYIWVCMYVW
jgi:hypothetical protein